jgi:hypothetical protein
MSDRWHRIVENYEMHLRTSEAGHLTESEIQRRVAHYGSSAVIDDGLLNQVRQVLCSAGVATMLFPYYHSFSRELGKLTREETSLHRLQTEVSWRVTKWVTRGLDRSVLVAIACSVFNIPLDSSPDVPPNQ